MRGLLVAALFFGTLAGCGLVSGLSDLEVSPACAGSACDAGSTPDGSAGDSKPPADTGADAGPDAAKLEAGPPGIACGTAQCTGSTVCCANDAGPTGCSSTACPGSTTIACDDQTDCPGMVCCYSNGQTQCATSCLGGDTICDPGTNNQCANPTTCKEVKIVSGVTLHNCD